MTRSTADQDLIDSLTETLHAAKLALESALSVSRPDLLDHREKTDEASKAALRRIGTKGGLGNYLADTLQRIEGDELAINIAAVAEAKRVQAEQAPSTSQMVIQSWDTTPESATTNPAFKLDIERMSDRLMVGLRPLAGDVDENRLNASFEVSGTSPAIHIYGGHDNVAITVFTDRKGGILIREGDNGPLENMIVAKTFMPDESAEQAAENSGNAAPSPNL